MMPTYKHIPLPSFKFIGSFREYELWDLYLHANGIEFYLVDTFGKYDMRNITKQGSMNPLLWKRSKALIANHDPSISPGIIHVE